MTWGIIVFAPLPNVNKGHFKVRVRAHLFVWKKKKDKDRERAEGCGEGGLIYRGVLLADAGRLIGFSQRDGKVCVWAVVRRLCDWVERQMGTAWSDGDLWPVPAPARTHTLPLTDPNTHLDTHSISIMHVIIMSNRTRAPQKIPHLCTVWIKNKDSVFSEEEQQRITPVSNEKLMLIHL